MTAPSRHSGMFLARITFFLLPVILSLTQNHGFLRSESRVGARDERMGAFWMRNVEDRSFQGRVHDLGRLTKDGSFRSSHRHLPMLFISIVSSKKKMHPGPFYVGLRCIFCLSHFRTDLRSVRCDVFVVGATGLEPATFCAPCRHASNCATPRTGKLYHNRHSLSRARRHRARSFRRPSNRSI